MAKLDNVQNLIFDARQISQKSPPLADAVKFWWGHQSQIIWHFNTPSPCIMWFPPAKNPLIQMLANACASGGVPL